MADSILSLERGQRLPAEPFYRALHDTLTAGWPRVPLYPALFGCSDEVNFEATAARNRVFGEQYGGFFTTRMIGSQVFYHQITVAISKGHQSNLFEVNGHVGERVDGAARRYGRLVGRDGVERNTCGALAHVLDDLRANTSPPSVSMVVDGELVLDFLGTIRFRLQRHRDAILGAPDPVLAITRANLAVQFHELLRQLTRAVVRGLAPAPVFVVGTISYNHVGSLDEETLQALTVIETDGTTRELTGPPPADEPWHAPPAPAAPPAP